MRFSPTPVLRAQLVPRGFAGQVPAQRRARPRMSGGQEGLSKGCRMVLEGL